jgi:hypothetical protein
MHEAIVQRRIVVVFKHTKFMPPTWTTCVTFVQPPVLTRSQGRLCQGIQREFIESLIRDLGPNYKVALIFALPKSDRVRIRPLWRILQYACIILQVGVPRTEEEWDYVVRWGRTTLPNGRFQEDDRITLVQN